MPSAIYIALMIGNSRYHWGLCQHTQLIHSCSSPYLSTPQIQQLIHQPTLNHFLTILNPPSFPTSSLPVPLFLASVVPKQTQLWLNYPQLRMISLADIPIANMYPSLGIDRALALFAATKSFGSPVLVIDAGTALTFSAVDAEQNFVGGAILPGVGLQLTMLENQTGQLPHIDLSSQLQSRWAMNTNDAIQSGIIYTLLAGIKDFIENWRQSFPDGKIVITGGDTMILSNYLQTIYPQIYEQILIEKNLVLQGICQVSHGLE